MQNTSWIAMLQRIPPPLHDGVILITTIGVEIALQQIIKMEEDYMVIRGRVAGSSDAGRPFFIPYDQLNYIGFQKPMKEEALRAMLGEPMPAAVEPPAEAPEAAGAEPEESKEPGAEPVAAANDRPTAQEPPKPAARAPLADKAALLERLRARSRGESGKP